MTESGRRSPPTPPPDPVETSSDVPQTPLSVLVDALAAYLAGNPGPRSGLVFRPELSRHTWARAHLRPAMLAAGVPPVRVHDLRHSYASWLVQDGVSLVEVARLLGHQSVNTTMRYSHLVPDAYDGVLSVLDGVGQTWATGSDNLRQTSRLSAPPA